MFRSRLWAIAILIILFIPLKIIEYGYLPGDDALRHAAKAVSGKPWPEILVLGPAFHFDPELGLALAVAGNLSFDTLERGGSGGFSG